MRATDPLTGSKRAWCSLMAFNMRQEAALLLGCDISAHFA